MNRVILIGAIAFFGLLIGIFLSITHPWKAAVEFSEYYRKLDAVKDEIEDVRAYMEWRNKKRKNEQF